VGSPETGSTVESYEIQYLSRHGWRRSARGVRRTRIAATCWAFVLNIGTWLNNSGNLYRAAALRSQASDEGKA
jgi:hypothetical protein